MMILPFTRTLALTLVAPAAALLPAVIPARASLLAPAESAALHARFDPSLAGLRAGRVAAPTELAAQERAALAAAQQRSPALAALRGGFEMTDNEWKWLAIGAAIVLILVLI
jgi:hypothetical protein